MANYRTLYEQAKASLETHRKVLEKYQDEVVPALRKELEETKLLLKVSEASKREFNASGLVVTLGTSQRERCPLWHNSGACVAALANCSTVNDCICRALQEAYDLGKRSMPF